MRQFKVTKSLTPRESESFSRYLVDVSHYEGITADEEVELMQEIRKGGKSGEKAKHKLVEANLRFVISVAKQYRSSGVPLEDLISEGNIGLMRAASTFDETQGFKFCSYAVWWIRQAIASAVEKNSLIRKPNNFTCLMREFRAFDGRMLATEGRNATIEEFLDAYDEQEKSQAKTEEGKKRQVYERSRLLGDHSASMSSLDKQINDDNTSTIADTIVSDYRADKESDDLDLHEDLVRMMSYYLSTKEKSILMSVYGIGIPQITLEECAKNMGLSRERVRQIMVSSIMKLQDSNASHVLRQYLN